MTTRNAGYGPRSPYGSFAGKAESVPLHEGLFTRNAGYGPRMRYGSFAGKAESDAPAFRPQSKLFISLNVGRMMK